MSKVTHGGRRPGAGRKKKPLAEKLLEGNPGSRRLKVLDSSDVSSLEGAEMPAPKSYMKQKQKNGKDTHAVEVFKSTWKWLEERKCLSLVPEPVIEQYAMSVARWIQCEEALSEFGFLAKHPTTGNPIQSPFVSMQQTFIKQANIVWNQIYQVVVENSAVDVSGNTPQDDAMERLLNARRGN